jgi:transposase
MDVHKDSMAVA